MRGIKHDSSKPRASLLPKRVLSAVVRVLEFGAQKYHIDNWKYIEDAETRYYDAMQRHIDAWWHGEKIDAESGEHHLAHAACCAMFLIWHDSNKPQEQIDTSMPDAIRDYQPKYTGGAHDQ